jgi:hypothetical protein
VDEDSKAVKLTQKLKKEKKVKKGAEDEISKLLKAKKKKDSDDQRKTEQEKIQAAINIATEKAIEQEK